MMGSEYNGYDRYCSRHLQPIILYGCEIRCMKNEMLNMTREISMETARCATKLKDRKGIKDLMLTFTRNEPID